MSAPAIGQDKLSSKFSKIKPEGEYYTTDDVKLREKPLELGSTPFNFDIFVNLGMSTQTFSEDTESLGSFNQRNLKIRGNRFLFGASYPLYRFAFTASLAYQIDQSEKTEGFRTKTHSYEANLSIEYNFSSPPFNEKSFPFIHVGLGLGNLKLDRSANISSGLALDNNFSEQKGRTKTQFLGIGLKKVFPVGIGLRASLDWLVKKEFLTAGTQKNYVNREKKGMLVNLGMFYQFR